LFNSGSFNTGSGNITDVDATQSGFGNTGNNVSGFYNTATGNFPSNMSGFFNSASGGNAANGNISGFFNAGVAQSFPPFFPPPATTSGFTSGYFNMGSFISGLFSLEAALS
jgi:hypothetical protein